MARQTYSIPDSLDKGMGDMEIGMRTRDGVPVKPVPMRIVLAWIGVVLLWFLLVFKTFIGSALGPALLFTASYLACALILLHRGKSGEEQYRLLPALASYLPASGRRVHARKADPAQPFQALTGIAGIDGQTGLIRFTDGGVGFLYRVVGNASLLLFDQDRATILDRVDGFYRTMKPGVETIAITMRQPQDTRVQEARIRQLAERYGTADPGLADLMERHRRILADRVGGQYRSIHQYLLVRAPNPDQLMAGKAMVQGEAESSGYMFKSLIPLFEPDISRVLGMIWKGGA